MQNITNAWKNFINKHQIWDNDYLNELEQFINWLDTNGFYGGNKPSENYSKAWAINIYYSNINIFTLSFIDHYLRIDKPKKCEKDTTRFQDHESLCEKLNNDRYWNSFIDVNKQTTNGISIEELRDWLLAVKNLILNQLTSKVELISLNLQNFRSFENEKLYFSSDFTVLIGENGSGKTSILEAIAIVISGFIKNFDSLTKSSIRNINANDIRIKGYLLGEDYRFEEQFPIRIASEYKFGIDKYSWTTYWKKKDMPRSVLNRKKISLLSSELEKEVREGNDNIILPVFAYYGTGRLWAINDVKDENLFEMEKISRIYAYNNCLKAQSDYEQFIKWFKFMKFKEFQKKKQIPGFMAVCNAIETIVRNSLSNNNEEETVKVDYDGTDIVIKFNNGLVKPLRLLSDGYKNVIGMVADIAHRMLILNPQLGENVLKKTSGIVLIDELDLHLHPKWQRHIINDLRTIFPNVQFIVTTHSPNILTTIQKENVIIIENSTVVEVTPHTYGRDINSILFDLMEVEQRPADVQRQIDEFYVLLDDEDLDSADEKLGELARLIGETDIEVVRARSMLDIERGIGLDIHKEE